MASTARRWASPPIAALVERAERRVVQKRRHEEMILRVLEDHAATAAGFMLRLLADLDGVDDDPPREADGVHDRQHQRGLARAVGADQPDALGGAERERHAAEGVDAVGVAYVKVVDLKQGGRVVHARSTSDSPSGRRQGTRPPP